ncbi:hydroxypyruvate isomerase [Methylovirgula sp. 4M-Z18]|uniref:hydroxypyruvate isomerase n=1 Tax=Methylovirgula sp. 4M-Z18 TaxID=2293567 RepID=UPI000E2FC56D|nr:hydroxypyruvate isomerase [Methylovirgula sp. 4M-Z18]RFB80915.1 hydroxypyruvate isomerase [Methylovirgula sp. 4M-Z18]
MTKFSANLSMLFLEVPFLERFGAAKKAGFHGVEYVSPYEFGAEEIAKLLSEHQLEQVLFNLPAGDWGKGERGIACHPDRVEEFRAGVDKAITYAKALQCPQVNCLAGIVPTDVSAADARATLVSNLRFAAERLQAAGILLLLEPINHYDIPGFCVTKSAQGISIMDEVGSANLKLQYDIYHMQRMEGELANTAQKLLPRIAHIQLADNPGRNEPGTGEINYPFLFAHLARIGYAGWIGCEYKPKGGTNAGLGWMKGLS